MFIHASAVLGNSMSSDFLWGFPCTGSLLLLAETAQGVIALRTTDHLSLLNPRPHHCTRLAGSLICHAIFHKCAIIKISNQTCRGF